MAGILVIVAGFSNDRLPETGYSKQSQAEFPMSLVVEFITN